ncbi:MAG TPA: hypothetical protein VK479_02295 [Micropepsaceae bacterium]|jgi:hypothetical protein|nr:hypothetical protein [Micropepsaceae bacterium]
MSRVWPKSIAQRTGLTLAGVLLIASAAVPATSQVTPPNLAPNPSVGWVALSGEFMPPPTGAGPVMRDPAHPRVSNDDYRASGAQPTFPMGDLSSPILQPWAREVLRKRNELVLSGKAAFPRQASCWPVGVPAFLLYPVQPVYFVQTPKEIVMTWQADHQIRHVYLTDKHSPRVKTSWYGESIGHYEGNMLVVDTIGLDARTAVDGFQTPHTEQLHVVERFHLIDGGKTLEVNLHVEDPGAFTTPWDAIQRYRRVEPLVAENPDPLNPVSSTSAEGPMIEASCAENPNSLMGMASIPIPQTTKPDF